MKRKLKHSNNEILFTTITYGITAVSILLVIYPLWFILIASISDYNAIYAGKVWLLPKDVTFEGYKRIFNDASIWRSYVNTILYTSLGTMISLTLTLTAGYALSRYELKFSKGFMLFFIITMYFSGGLIPTYLLVDSLGMIDTIWAMVIPGCVGVWNLITARWVDNLFEPYTAAQLRWGPIGEIYEKTAEGKLVNLPLPEGVTMGELRQKVAPGGGSPSIVLAEDFGTIVDMEPRAVERLENIVDVYSPFLVSENYPQVTFTVEELQVIDELLGDVMELTNEKRANWLMNGFSDKDWEKYLKVLNSIGINELISVYQSALDRYNNY